MIGWLCWLVLCRLTSGFYYPNVMLGGRDPEFMAYPNNIFGGEYSTTFTYRSYAHQAIAATSSGIWVGGTTEGVLDSATTGETSQGRENAFGVHVQVPGLTTTGSSYGFLQVFARNWLSDRYISAPSAVLAAATTSNDDMMIAGMCMGRMEPSSIFSGSINCQASNSNDCAQAAFIVFFNSAKEAQWGYMLSPPVDVYTQASSRQARYSAIVVTSNAIWAVGHANDEICSSGSQCDRVGSYDVIRSKFSMTGYPFGHYNEGTFDADHALGAKLGLNDEFFVGGNTEGDWGNGHAGKVDILLFKVGSSGDRSWAVTYGTSEDDLFAAMQVDSSGDVYLAGNTGGSLDGSSSGGGTYDYFLSKFSGTDGQRAWTLQRGSNTEEMLNGFIISTAGDFWLTGTLGTSSSHLTNSMDGVTGYGYSDAFVVWLEQSGSGAPTHKQTFLIGSDTNEVGQGLVEVTNNIYLVGQTCDHVIYDSYPQHDGCGEELFIQLLTTSTSTQTQTSVTTSTATTVTITSTSATMTTSTSSTVTTTSSTVSSTTSVTTTTTISVTSTSFTSTSTTTVSSTTSATSSTTISITSTSSTATSTTTISSTTSATSTTTISSTTTSSSSSSTTTTTSSTSSTTSTTTSSSSTSSSSTSSSSTSSSSTSSSSTSSSSTSSSTSSTTTTTTSSSSTSSSTSSTTSTTTSSSSTSSSSTSSSSTSSTSATNTSTTTSSTSTTSTTYTTSSTTTSTTSTSTLSSTTSSSTSTTSTSTTSTSSSSSSSSTTSSTSSTTSTTSSTTSTTSSTTSTTSSTTSTTSSTSSTSSSTSTTSSSSSSSSSSLSSTSTTSGTSSSSSTSSRTSTWTATSTTTATSSTSGTTTVSTSATGVTSAAVGSSVAPETTVTTAPVVCSTLPSGTGVIASDCVGKTSGESCQVVCDSGFVGGPAQYVCNGGTFEGSLTCEPATCPTDTLPQGLDSTCASTPLGGQCFVRCPQGYVFAESVYTCGSDGIFTGSPPVCEVMKCSSDGLPSDYRLNVSSCSGATVGSACEVTCKWGFESATQSSAIQCGNDGSFVVGVVPSCTPKVCSAPATSSAWTTDCEGITHEQTCMAFCSAGYSGVPTQFLCEDGAILGQQPSCVGLPCTYSGEIAVGLDVSPCEGTTTGNTCSSQCIFGYEGVGDPVMTCRSDGSFLQSQFECQATVCGRLSDVSTFASQEFKHSCADLSFGQSCSVQCDTGWEIQGEPVEILCNSTPSHSAGYGSTGVAAANSTPPTCMAKPCTARLPDIRGATHDCAGKTTLQTCSVEAASGFTSNGATLQCGTDGEFKGDFPVIEATVCATPNFELGVSSTCANKSVGVECWAYCVTGYTGTPQAYRCEADGTVAPRGQNVSCTAAARRLGRGRGLSSACGQSAALDFGLEVQFEHSCSPLADLEVCISHCSQGYAMSGDASVLTCEAGALTGTLPTCSPEPCKYNLPSALGVGHNCTNVTTGSSCFATCSMAGYSYSGASGPEIFTCLPTAEFEGNSPSCAPSPCENLTLGAAYTHNCRGLAFQDVCSVACAEGYSLTGAPAQYTCSASGTIEGTLPSCTANPCSNTISTAFDSNCDGITTGDTCNVSCQAGMVPNHAEMTCHATGLLIGLLPGCLPAKCPANQSLQALAIAHNCENVTFGQSCSVYCGAGYRLAQGGGELWQCLFESALTLTGSLPACEAETCSVDLNPSDSLSNDCGTSLVLGTSCVQSCRKGYTSTNSSTSSISCNSDLSLDMETRPQCSLVSCETSELTSLFPKLEHSCSGVTVNRSCFAFCRLGYTGDSVAQWTCAESAGTPLTEPVDGFALQGDIPTCVPQTCIYNIPTGAELSHDCGTVSTDQSCSVSCAAGWLGSNETLTCGSDRTLSGNLPSCVEITTTADTTSTTSVATTTTSPSNWTIYVRGVIDLQPRLADGPLGASSLQSFAEDPDVALALHEAVAAVHNVSVASVELNVSVATVAARRLAEVVRVEYLVGRGFESLALARAWADDKASGEQVQGLMNQNLVGTAFQVTVLDFQLEVMGLPSAAAASSWVNPTYILAALGALLFGLGLLVLFQLCRKKASPPEPEPVPPTPSEHEAVQIVTEEPAAAAEAREAASDVDSIEIYLQQLAGVGFTDDAEEEASDEELNDVRGAADASSAWLPPSDDFIDPPVTDEDQFGSDILALFADTGIDFASSIADEDGEQLDHAVVVDAGMESCDEEEEAGQSSDRFRL